MTPDGLIERIVETVVRCTAPHTVILFGSAARGTMRCDSDVDLLVIGDFHQPPAVRGVELRGLLGRLPVQVDLHLLTPSELEAQRRVPHSFAATVARHGRCVYAAS